MVTEKNMLSVKVLNRKMAEQVEVLSYDWKEDSRYKEIWRELHTTDGSGSVAVFGWVTYCPGLESSKRAPNPIKWWLVKQRGQYLWFAAPAKDSDVGKLYWPGLEQLFVG